MIGVPPSPHSRLCGAHLVLSAKLLGDNERKDDSRDRRVMPVSRVARWTAYRFRADRFATRFVLGTRWAKLDHTGSPIMREPCGMVAMPPEPAAVLVYGLSGQLGATTLFVPKQKATLASSLDHLMPEDYANARCLPVACCYQAGLDRSEICPDFDEGRTASARCSHSAAISR